MTIFPDIAGVLIEHISMTDEVTLTGRTTSPTASCPSCETDSSRIQSRYTRTHGSTLALQPRYLYSRPRSPRARLIDPYTTYLAQSWYQGCHNGSQLEEEVRARGYTGSQRGIYRYLATLEPSAFPNVSRRAAAPPTQVAPSRPSNPRLSLSARASPPGSFSAGEPTRRKKNSRTFRGFDRPAQRLRPPTTVRISEVA